MSRRAFVEVIIGSQDITSDISGDVLSFSYTDNASEEADDFAITLQNRNKRWLYNWWPQEGATLRSKIITKNWSGKLNCGKFIIDDVSMGGWPLTTDIKAIAMPVNETFSGAKKNKTWSKATIKEIATSIAGNSSIPLYYDATYNPVINFVAQTDVSDKDFLYNFCSKYGLTMKLYSNKIVLYDMVEKESKSNVFKLTATDMMNFSANSTIADTGYSTCVVKYTTKNAQVLQHSYSIQGKTEKIYTHTEQVDSLAEAQRVARAKLRELNMKETTFSCSLPGDTRFVAAISVEIMPGFGHFSGKYFIDKATHAINGSGGYTTNLEMHKVIRYA